MRGIVKKYDTAFNAQTKIVEREIRNSLSKTGYWGGFESSRTRRSNGEIVTGARRNILDTGELIQSMRSKTTKTRTTGALTFEISFDADHYRYVRFGTRNMAGRDFVKRGIDRAFSFRSMRSNLLGKVKIGD